MRWLFFFFKDGHSHGSMAANCSLYIDMFTLLYTCFSLFLVYTHWHFLGSNLWLHVVQHSLWCCFRTVVFPVLTVAINSHKQSGCNPPSLKPAQCNSSQIALGAWVWFLFFFFLRAVEHAHSSLTLKTLHYHLTPKVSNYLFFILKKKVILN